MDSPRITISLPKPRTNGSMALETALARRRTVRDFRPRPLTAAEVGQLLWAAQGVTHGDGKRAAPSASGLFGLEVYAATADGLTHYLPAEHALERLADADIRPALQVATGHQPFVGTAPLVVVLAIVPGRIAGRHGPDRGVRYADFEAGHAGQNLLLQAVALDLGAVPIGSFRDDEVNALLGLPEGQVARYLFAVGRLL